jgi:hypothetical protein
MALPGLPVILTEGVRMEFTVIVTLLLVAGLPVAHGVAFEVITTFTTSLFASVVVTKVALLVPACTPFTCH